VSTNTSSQPADDMQHALPRLNGGAAGRASSAATAETAPGEPRTVGLGLVAALVLCSGACGLIYQTAWLRELRLIFGTSTSATAATLAIFMAGLGAGSLWLGARVNLLAGLAALGLGARASAPAPALRLVPAAAPVDAARGNAARSVYAAAALVGFVFFLMEIVWYRMLTPLLGGTTYTFGLILAVALLGISAGSALYGPIAGRRTPTHGWFALTC